MNAEVANNIESTARGVAVVGGGLAGTEAALCLVETGIPVTLFEMRPVVRTPVHRTDGLAELVCSNSFKGTRPDSAAGLLKQELEVLASPLFRIARSCRIPAGGALAVDRVRFSEEATKTIESHESIALVRDEVSSLSELDGFDAAILATGPLTSDALSDELVRMTNEDQLSFFDAAAPIVMAESLDRDVIFEQSRYEDKGSGDYLNAPMDKDEYLAFIYALVHAERVVSKDFETKELFQACQPIEEVARTGVDAPRFGALKPVGLTDPRTGRRPYAAVQLRREDAAGQSFNLVGFQTNLTFPEQKRVFCMIPGLEHAEFARFGVMHRNTFMDAPRLLDTFGRLFLPKDASFSTPVYVAGQLSGTEGYTEAIRSGMNCALAVIAQIRGVQIPPPPVETVFGALMHHATDPETKQYQPMHVNFGVMPPLDEPIRNKRARYQAFADRACAALAGYASALSDSGVWSGS